MEKIAHFCQVEMNQVVVVRDMPSIYEVPVLLEEQGLVPLLLDILKLDRASLSPRLVEKGDRTWDRWKSLTCTQNRFFETVSIVLAGKYIELHDSYLSVIKSLEHSAMRCRRKLNLIWVDAEHLEPSTLHSDPAKFHKAWHQVCTADGILVPGGFGKRGTEGMIAAAKWAREHGTPYLGICLGMQTAVIEFARNVCGIEGASSEEFDKNCDGPVIIYMPEIDKTNLGGTMRLGLRPTIFQQGSEWSKLRALYGERKTISERHRHRYEVNPDYVERLEVHGLSFIGKDDAGVRMEIIELMQHPWYVAIQFHPEYLSRVLRPSKPFLGFVAASAGCLEQITEETLSEARKYMVNGVDTSNEAPRF